MKEKIYQFLDYIVDEKNYSSHTELNYDLDLFKFNSYVTKYNLNYKKIEYKDITNYIKSLKDGSLNVKTINRNLSTLRSFYKYLQKNKVIKTNPFLEIKSLKVERKLPNYFKYDEFIEMISSMQEETPLNIRNKLILELLFATGIRVSELTDIKLNDIDIYSSEIKIRGKGSKERIVYFGSHSKEALSNYLNQSRDTLLKGKESSYLLINNSGGNLTDRGIRGIINNIIKKTSIAKKITPHTFRHSFATIMLSEGASIKSVQELLGHSSLNTTSIYTHLTNEEIRRTYLNSHPRAKK